MLEDPLNPSLSGDALMRDILRDSGKVCDVKFWSFICVRFLTFSGLARMATLTTI